MTGTKQLILIALAIVLFSSCAKLPVYNSNEYIQNQKEEFLNPIASNYDSKTNISFNVSNNDTNIYISAVFHDRQSYIKIMRGGLIIYFDPSGKKKKQYQLKIERSQKQEIDMASMSSQMGMNPSARSQDLPAVINASFTKVTWDKGDDNEFVFYRNILKNPIGVELGSNQANEFTLEVKMPLKEIPLEDGQNLFAVGIESGAISTSRMQTSMQSSGMRSSGGRSGGGGGGGGGRGGGGGMSGGSGMSGGKSGGGSRPSGGIPSGMEPIKLWFQVQL